MRKSPKFSPEVQERAVRMVFDAKELPRNAGRFSSPDLLGYFGPMIPIKRLGLG